MGDWATIYNCISVIVPKSERLHKKEDIPVEGLIFVIVDGQNCNKSANVADSNLKGEKLLIRTDFSFCE